MHFDRFQLFMSAVNLSYLTLRMMQEKTLSMFFFLHNSQHFLTNSRNGSHM